MQNDSDVPRLLLPEGPGFFGLSDSTLVVDKFYESHGVGGSAEYLNDIVDDFAALTPPS